MRYTCSVDIDAPIERVVELITDPDRMTEWMAGLDSVTTVRGERGAAGSVNQLHFVGAPGDGLMLERIESVGPDNHHAIYQLGPVTNHQRSRFDELPDGRTRWTAEHEFLLPPGMVEQMGPGAEEVFTQNTQQSMGAFKAWVELAA